MGASNSRFEDDKSLLLCRERKKFIKQALNGRCSLAAAHIAYIEELRIIGTALRRFIENDAQPEPCPPEPRDLTDKSTSQYSSSRSSSQNVVSGANISPSPSIIPPSSNYQLHHMKSRGKISRKVEEKLPEPVTFSVSSNTPLSTTPRSTDASEPSLAETTPWDYFGLFNPVDDHFSVQDGPMNIPELERDGDDMFLSDGIDESQGSEDEFDEPSSATLVRSFKNLNVVGVENAEEIKENLVDGDLKSENKVGNGTKKNSPDLSPLRGPSSRFVQLNDVKITPMEQSQVEDEAAPKDFVSSLKDIEQLFVKASESGIEVPLMLEANKFHFRPVFRGERGLISSALLKSCFSCGDDPSEARQDQPAQNPVKYLTWHRSTSFRSGSYRNLLSANSTDDAGNNLFDNFCMVSGSHASTLDRLYAWEKKLYDEVKAVQVLRSHFDHKCKVLGQQESRGENTDKTRARVKDLHSRIGVAIHRINSISKKIEDIRDKELQPQLEELIQGLGKMWEQMMECHKLQLHIVSISQAPGGAKITIQTNSRKQTTVLLGNELSSLSSTFTKWIGTQRLYVESIEKWLVKCVWLQKTTSKRNKRIKPPPLRNLGPPIYMICGAWLEMIGNLPAKGVTDSIKELTDQVARFHKGSSEGGTNGGDHDGVSLLASEDWVPVLDRFQTSLMGFLGQLDNFAESSAKMFVDLQEAIQQAKNNYELYKSQRGL
ncbi:hypothetical protein CASFOL_030255 [Castilleja foliolosa]|uniref:BZIP transcription factor n=1 Tax=Castilleja foliolosa TaxID=1961234 RepID=A0ABD3C8Q5_9LAMI